MLVRSTSAVIQCQVVLFDNTEFVTAFEKKSIRGQDLLDRTCRRVQVPPHCTKYFGLRFADPEDGGMNWLHLEQEIKASKKNKELHYQFAVKVFPPNPQKLEDRFVRKQLMLQLKELISRGNLSFPVEQHAALDGFYAQAMLGNFNKKTHTRGYLDDLLGLFYAPPTGLNVDDSGGLMSGANYEIKVRDLHKSHKDMSEDDAILGYLDLCGQLPSYGAFEYRGAKDLDSKGREVIFTVSHKGVQVYEVDRFDKPGDQLYQLNWRDILSMFCHKIKFCIITGSLKAEECNDSRTMYSFRFGRGHFGHKDAARLLRDAENHQEIFLEGEPDSREMRRTVSLQLKRKARHGSRMLHVRTQPLGFSRGSSRF